MLNSAVLFHLEWYLVSFFFFFKSTNGRICWTEGLTLWTSGVNFGQGSDEAPFAGWAMSYHGHSAPQSTEAQHSTAQCRARLACLSFILKVYLTKVALCERETSTSNQEDNGEHLLIRTQKHGCIRYFTTFQRTRTTSIASTYIRLTIPGPLLIAKLSFAWVGGTGLTTLTH